MPGQAQLAAHGHCPDTGADGVLVGVLVMLLEAGQPDAGVRVAAHTLHYRVHGLLQADDIEGAAVEDVAEDGVDVIDQGIQYQPGLGAFLLPVAGGCVGLEGAPGENVLERDRAVGTEPAPQQRVVFLAGLGEVDEDVLAVIAHLVDVLGALHPESLHHEGRFQPRPVQAADKHADFQVTCCDFQGMEHGRSPPPFVVGFRPFVDNIAQLEIFF